MSPADQDHLSSKALKLIAKDAEDIEVVATVLQDAIAPLCDMIFQEAEHSFILVVHRFCWDHDADAVEHERIRCAINVSGVVGAKVLGLNQHDVTQMLDLLTVELKDKNMVFVFAGGVVIKLDLADWVLKIEDFGEPWPTLHVPVHGD